ncbi:MAG: hypothetical protein JXQ72_01945 [Anaerolineae bacterium]|nr:hypothetical protein [Anaerolineae bacterium]
MARQKAQQKAQEPAQEIRYPLLVYRVLGKRYRSPAILLIIMGIVLLLPSFISDLENEQVEPAALAGVGGVLILVGLAFWLFSRLAIKHSYVQANPDLLVIRTPFYRLLVSYRRISHAKSVKVSNLYPAESLKGMGKPLMRPLLGMTAVELVVKSWPAPKRRLRRFLSEFMFSTRDEAWVFIVPQYSRLMNQIDASVQGKASQRRGTSTQYEDPFERLKYYDN